MNTHTDVEYCEGYRPGVIGRIAELHGVYYAQALDYGASFEGLVASGLHEFMTGYRSGRELLLTAQLGGRAIGSIVVDGSESERLGARLRYVIVESGYHGRGIGKELLRRALAFCRKADYTRIHLWTVEGLPQSFALYTQAGFRVVERVADARLGVLQTNLRMELTLV